MVQTRARSSQAARVSCRRPKRETVVVHIVAYSRDSRGDRRHDPNGHS